MAICTQSYKHRRTCKVYLANFLQLKCKLEFALCCVSYSIKSVKQA